MGNENSKTHGDELIFSNPTQNSNTHGDELIFSNPTQYSSQMSQISKIFTDPAIKTIISQIPHECSIIWHDPDIFSHEKNSICKSFREVCTVHPFKVWKEAVFHLEKSKIPCFVISSSEGGEILTTKISEYSYRFLWIYIYCEDVGLHNQWAKKNKKIALVTNKEEELQAAVISDIISWKFETFSSKIEPPSTLTTTLNQKRFNSQILSSRLKEVITMIDDRDEARRDFLNLAKALCKNIQYIERFEVEYQPELVMRWFKEGELISKVVNICLSLNTLESITYCRSIVSDLRRAIWKIYRDKIQEKSVSNSNFCGRLYHMVFMESIEWEAYQRNIGQDITFTNFFQAESELSFDLAFMVKIIIIVPEKVDEEGQGFANIGENKIIFNIFSRFHILEANGDTEHPRVKRTLILIYCTQTKKKDNLKFSVSEAPYICQYCEESFEREKKLDFYANLLEKCVEYTCQNCLKKDFPKEISPLLRVSFEMVEDEKIFKANRAKIREKLPLGIPFGVNCCSRCKSRDLKIFYKCTDCQRPENIWCQSCVEQKKECRKEGHLIVYEKSSSRFCNDGAKKLIKNAEIYEEAEDLEKTEEYDEALELYHEVIKKNQIVEAETYQKLGRISCKKKESQKAEQYFQKALVLMKSVNEESQIVGKIHKDLGEIKEAAGDLILALDHYFQALKVFKENCGMESEEVLKLNNVISEAYKCFMKKKREMIRYLREAQEAYEKYSEIHRVNSPEINQYKEKYLERFRLWKEYQNAEEKFPDFLKEI